MNAIPEMPVAPQQPLSKLAQQAGFLCQISSKSGSLSSIFRNSAPYRCLSSPAVAKFRFIDRGNENSFARFLLI
jgi:hypothetical protein